MNESAKQQAFTEGSVFRSLIRFALPVLGALALQEAYGAAAYVAQNVGAGKPDRAKKGFFTAIVCGCTAGLLLFSPGFFGGGILSALFTDDTEVALQSANYLKGYSLECILSCILFACCGSRERHARFDRYRHADHDRVRDRILPIVLSHHQTPPQKTRGRGCYGNGRDRC